MAKKGIASIGGNPNPTIGKPEVYHAKTMYPDTNLPQTDYDKIKWILFKKVNGEWVEAVGNAKTGYSASYTFSEHSINKELLLEAYIKSPEMKVMPGMLIKPIAAEKPSFTKLELQNTEGKDIKEALSYGQTIVAKATCVGMEGQSVTFQLWEDDMPGEGHNSGNEKNGCETQTQIVKKGIATANFFLKPDFAKIADAYLASGDTSEGANHEYYVTVQDSKTFLASKNANVKNPNYKPPAPVESKPKPSTPVPVKPAPTPEPAPKQPDPIKVIVKPEVKPDPKPEPKNSPVVVGATPKPKGKEDCPNCDKDISVSELRKVYKDAKDDLLVGLAAGLNKYRKKLGLNTCARKAHFFAQSLQEVSTSLTPGLEGESLNYAATALPVQFKNFRAKGGGPNDLAYKYGRTKDHKADQRMIGNIAYNGRLGNKMNSEDGWNFRGRGLLQITGRENYNDIQKVIDKQCPGSGINVSEGTAASYTPEQAALTGMADWFKDKMYLKADLSNQGVADDKVVDAIVNIINRDTDSRPQRKVWYRGGKAGDVTVSSANSMKSLFQVNSCNGAKPKVETPVAADAKGIVTYHIYSDGKIERHVPKSITSGFENKYKYVYHDSKSVVHVVCTTDWNETSEKSVGKKSTGKPSNDSKVISDENISEGQTNRRIKYENGDIAEHGSNNGSTFWMLYKSTGNKVKLVRMPDSLNMNEPNAIIKYTFTGTRRRYTGRDYLAVFIGALAECGFSDIQTGGSCFKEASCFPSFEHVNGVSIDTNYVSHAREQKFINALMKFGMSKQLVGPGMGYANTGDGGHLHDSHLHSGRIPAGKVIVIEEK
jgi:predicted chitinase